MYYGNIKPVSVENGPGVRVSLFVSGCRNHCKGCFSAQTWDFTYGQPFTRETEDAILAQLSESFEKGLTVLGGEPMEPENQKELLPFLRRVKEKLPGKTIWIYTGFVLGFTEEGPELMDPEKEGPAAVRANTPELPEILKLTDVLVDGRFSEEEASLLLRFRGSENQRIIRVQDSLAAGKVITDPEYMKRGL